MRGPGIARCIFPQRSKRRRNGAWGWSRRRGHLRRALDGGLLPGALPSELFCGLFSGKLGGLFSSFFSGFLGGLLGGFLGGQFGGAQLHALRFDMGGFLGGENCGLLRCLLLGQFGEALLLGVPGGLFSGSVGGLFGGLACLGGGLFGFSGALGFAASGFFGSLAGGLGFDFGMTRGGGFPLGLAGNLVSMGLLGGAFGFGGLGGFRGCGCMRGFGCGRCMGCFGVDPVLLKLALFKLALLKLGTLKLDLFRLGTLKMGLLKLDLFPLGRFDFGSGRVFFRGYFGSGLFGAETGLFTGLRPSGGEIAVFRPVEIGPGIERSHILRRTVGVGQRIIVSHLALIHHLLSSSAHRCLGLPIASSLPPSASFGLAPFSAQYRE